MTIFSVLSETSVAEPGFLRVLGVPPMADLRPLRFEIRRPGAVTRGLGDCRVAALLAMTEGPGAFGASVLWEFGFV